MGVVEIVMICTGLSLDVFAVCICEGSKLMLIKKRKLIIICFIFSLFQILAVECGNLISKIPVFSQVSSDVQKIWQFFSVIIFTGIGIYMLYKAWKKESLLEQRSEIRYGEVFLAALITSLDALFAGIGIGFFGAGMAILAGLMGIITFLAVILGTYTGYRLGYEQKTKAYWAGGFIFVAAGIDVIIRYF